MMLIPSLWNFPHTGLGFFIIWPPTSVANHHTLLLPPPLLLFLSLWVIAHCFLPGFRLNNGVQPTVWSRNILCLFLSHTPEIKFPSQALNWQNLSIFLSPSCWNSQKTNQGGFETGISHQDWYNRSFKRWRFQTLGRQECWRGIYYNALGLQYSSPNAIPSKPGH